MTFEIKIIINTDENGIAKNVDVVSNIQNDAIVQFWLIDALNKISKKNNHG